MESILENILCSLRFDQILRNLQLLQRLIPLQGNGNNLSPIDANIIILQPKHLQILILQKHSSQTSSPINPKRILPNGAFHNTQIQASQVYIFYQLLQNQGYPDLANHVAGDVQALNLGRVEQIFYRMHPVLRYRIIC